jgi:hypothetical protein
MTHAIAHRRNAMLRLSPKSDEAVLTPRQFVHAQHYRFSPPITVPVVAIEGYPETHNGKHYVFEYALCVGSSKRNPGLVLFQGVLTEKNTRRASTEKSLTPPSYLFIVDTEKDLTDISTTCVAPETLNTS